MTVGIWVFCGNIGVILQKLTVCFVISLSHLIYQCQKRNIFQNNFSIFLWNIFQSNTGMSLQEDLLVARQKKILVYEMVRVYFCLAYLLVNAWDKWLWHQRKYILRSSRSNLDKDTTLPKSGPYRLHVLQWMRCSHSKQSIFLLNIAKHMLVTKIA